MSHSSIEIEIKLPLHNPDEVKAFLDKEAEIKAKDVMQRDTYYVPAHRDFLDRKYVAEWLRLRESTKGYSVNYKHFYPEDVPVTEYCDEFETTVNDVEAMKKIFGALNMKEAVVVEKYRTTRMYEEVEIVIDQVTDLGGFIELECKKEFPTPQEAKTYLYSVLDKLGAKCGETDHRGYPFWLLEKKGYKFGE